VAAAGKVGNVVIAGGEQENLDVGTHVRLVCRSTSCAPGVHVGTARPAAQPPILPVVLAERDFIPGSMTDDEVSGRINGGHTSWVIIYLNKQGTRRWCSFTRSHIARSFVAVVDGVVMSKRTIRSPACQAQSVSVPLRTPEQAYWIMRYIAIGPLPVVLWLLP
jgi:preprotein translocase subunit SecD